MESLRVGTFETNSSSCHAMVLMSAEMYGKPWRKHFFVEWKRSGSEYEPGAGTIMDDSTAIDTLWKDYTGYMDSRGHRPTLTKEQFGDVIMKMSEGVALEVIREEYKTIGDREADSIDDSFYDYQIESSELCGSTYVQLGDVVGIVFEKEC